MCPISRTSESAGRRSLASRRTSAIVGFDGAPGKGKKPVMRMQRGRGKAQAPSTPAICSTASIGDSLPAATSFSIFGNCVFRSGSDLSFV